MAGYNQNENNEFNENIEQEYLIDSGDLEGLLDAIADALIRSPLVETSTVEANQKFIRNSQIQTGQGEGVLALFQKDVEANVEDDLQSIADQIVTDFTIAVTAGANDTIDISIVGGGFTSGGFNITNLVIGDGNPLNVSQFIPIQKQKSEINVDRAEEFLDTNIFELIPEGDTRQARIIRLFNELNALLPPDLPNFGTPVNRDIEGDWNGAESYSQDNSISYAQDNADGNIDEEEAFIHRLKTGSINNPDSLLNPNDANASRTIEDIYKMILPYLTDILEDPPPPQDDRPVYENQSNGYLKFRSLNQGIIIRNTTSEFIDGLDPNNLTYLDRVVEVGESDEEIELGTGFTITMWVRFLDKVSSGTLFNFGNPTRSENPFGFKLETFVVNKDDKISVTGEDSQTFGEYTPANHQGLQGDKQLFKSTDVERFVRLQVREFDDRTSQFGSDDGLRDSGLGYPGIRKFPNNPPDLDKTDDGQFRGSDERRLINYTHIPQDFNEWYFICASYNPIVDEFESMNTFYDQIGNDGLAYKFNPNFWLNHINPLNGDFMANSSFGNKCKVEIISRTDLLRARGFKV